MNTSTQREHAYASARCMPCDRAAVHRSQDRQGRIGAAAVKVVSATPDVHGVGPESPALWLGDVAESGGQQTTEQRTAEQGRTCDTDVVSLLRV